jgi:hypothetical protein
VSQMAFLWSRLFFWTAFYLILYGSRFSAPMAWTDC